MSKIQNFKMLIDGEWVESSSEKKIESQYGSFLNFIKETKS